VDVITSTHNSGFSAGCNLGIRRALDLGADRVLLLNSDVIVAPDMPGELERALDENARLGIVGPIVLSLTEPDRVQSAGIAYSLRTGRMRHRDFGRPRSALDEFRVRIVDGVSGCAMLIRREVIDRIGLLAEEYFFGFEDLDYCLRARQAGFLTACTGRASVLHEGSVSIGRTSPRRVYFATRNHLLLTTRFGNGSRLSRWTRTASVLALNLAFVATTSELPRREGLRGFVSGVRDYFAGRFGGAAAPPR
jgi:GT2 family glycosyltransferase